MVLSRLAVASRLPSGLQARSKIQSAWSSIRATSFPVATSQTRTARSAPAAASRVPSGLKATAKTLSVVSRRSRASLPPPSGSAIQSCTEPNWPGSPLAVAIHLPSGLYAMSWTRSAIPRSRRAGEPSSTFHVVTSWKPDATTSAPSGLIASAVMGTVAG